MLLTHALRCRCQVCNRLLAWDEADAQGIVRARCCKKVYALKTWTVKVAITTE